MLHTRTKIFSSYKNTYYILFVYLVCEKGEGRTEREGGRARAWDTCGSRDKHGRGQCLGAGFTPCTLRDSRRQAGSKRLYLPGHLSRSGYLICERPVWEPLLAPVKFPLGIFHCATSMSYQSQNLDQNMVQPQHTGLKEIKMSSWVC